MSEELLQSNGDASPESSSPAPESAASNSEQTSNEAQSKETNLPFHEHPRFKELIEERNQWKSQFSDIQRKMQEYEERFKANEPKEVTPEMKMVEELKQIRPEFGQLIENMLNKMSKVEHLESDWQRQQSESASRNVTTQLNTLHEQAKVPAELRETYRLHIKALADANPKLGLQDLPQLHKQVHDQYSKFIDGIRRSERESYLKSKKADAALPQTQPKGPAAKPGSKPQEFSSDPDKARKELVSRIMQSVRSQSSENA